MSKAVLSTLRHHIQEALAQGRLDEAGDILARLKREDPLSRETRGLELELHLNSNRLDEAESLAEQLCRLFPDSGRILFLAGKTAYRQKRYGKAASCFRESVRVYPHQHTRYWLGKTLTQMGSFGEAESLLLSVVEQAPYALMDLAWLSERRNELESALRFYEQYLETHPDNSYAEKQRVRIKAKMLEPEALIEEVDTLSEWGSQVSDLVFPEFVQRLFETGEGPRAREEIKARRENLDNRSGSRLAWVCYRAQAYDLACTLFLDHLRANVGQFKYLSALEAAGRRCGRIPEVIEAYNELAPHVPKLHGRTISLARRLDHK